MRSTTVSRTCGGVERQVRRVYARWNWANSTKSSRPQAPHSTGGSSWSESGPPSIGIPAEITRQFIHTNRSGSSVGVPAMVSDPHGRQERLGGRRAGDFSLHPCNGCRESVTHGGVQHIQNPNGERAHLLIYEKTSIRSREQADSHFGRSI